MKKVNIYVSELGEDFLNKPTEEFEKELPISDPVPVEKKEITQSALNKRLSRIQNSIKTTTDKANEIIETSEEVQNKINELVGGSNIIYYKASNKLPEVTEGEGLHTDAFNVQIISHDFENGEGTIIFRGDVTEIGNQAFYRCTDLIDITIPDKVESIGDYAFDRCTSLLGIIFPESVTSIGNYALSSCSGLTEIDIPNNISINDIGPSAFNGCDNIERISVGKKFVENEEMTGGSELFDNWDGVELIIKPGATFIGNYCFAPYNDDAHFNNVIIPDTVTKIGDYAFYNTYIKNIEIPNSITEIGEGAFKACDFEEFVIPDSVTSIGNETFYGCSELTSIIIGSGVTSIGSEVFYNCSSLTSITVDVNNTTYDSRNNCNAIIETSTNILIQGCNNTIIPDNVISIGNSAFVTCSELTSINIPDSVTSIGEYAFMSCSELTSINIPDNVTSIGDSAFRYCSELTSITIGSCVTSIGSEAFRGCLELTSITSLAKTAPTIFSDTFEKVKTGGTLIVPGGSTGYDVWMGTGNYYLGNYGWTINMIVLKTTSQW